MLARACCCVMLGTLWAAQLHLTYPETCCTADMAKVFAVATKRAAKTAAWAGEYARLCARFRAAAWPVKLDEPFAEALHGRSVQVRCRCAQCVQNSHPRLEH